jgi:outer membrane protein OmpA-like peptidoglycan-associated protein
MTQSVTRLKELLFDTEAGSEDLSHFERRFEDAAERLKTLEALTADEKQERLEVLRKLDGLFARAGTEEYLSSSVAHVLDDALRKAEVEKHDDMARALAPMVVRTIKTELKNSQDEMVQALYPLTGRMVKAYVASAIRDLTDQINRRLEHNPFSLRLRSWMSGTSVADLAIARSQRLRVEEILLIRRGSGVLLARWPEGREALSNSDQHLSGVLSAINDFASHAFEDDGGNLRTFTLDDYEIALRASPVFLIAAKCRGIAPSGAEQVFDDAFLALLERLHELGWDGRGAIPTNQSVGTWRPLAEAVEARTTEIYDRNEQAGLWISPSRLLLFVIAVPLFAWAIWSAYTGIEERMTLSTARTVIAGLKEFDGYPLTLEVGHRGRTLDIQGLAPTAAARAKVLAGLKNELPGTEVQSRLSVLPTPQVRETVDLSPQIEDLQRQLATLEEDVVRRQQWRALTHSLDGTVERLRLLGPEMAVLLGLVASDPDRTRAARAKADIEAVSQAIAALQRDHGTPPERPEARAKLADDIMALAGRLRQVTGRVSALVGGATTAASGDNPNPKRVAHDAVNATEILAAESHRAFAMVLAVTKAIQQARLIKPTMIPPPPIRPPTAREKLAAFVGRQAIFFAEGTDLRAPRAAARKLDELATLMKGNALVVRVIGYTDETGRRGLNDPLAAQRAEAVASELVRRGVPDNRLIVVGRADRLSLSSDIGAASPNRRVEFAIGFDGERRP